MLDALWLAVLGVVDVWALWAGHELLALAASLGLLVALSIVMWRRFSLVGIGYRRRLAAQRVQLGEVVELTVEFANRKILPLALLQIRDQMPRHLRIEGGTVYGGSHEVSPYLHIVRSMLPYERVLRRLRVHCARRGEHEFGPVRWESSDYLGAAAQYRTDNETQRLLVLPKVFPLAMSRPASHQLLGRDATQRWLFTDPLRTVGAREYVPGDPMRLVDWRATARRGTFMVRELEPSTTPSLQIALNFEMPDSAVVRFEPDEVECAISVAASLAAHAAERKWRVGLVGNASTGRTPLAVPASSAPAQLGMVLEALARTRNIPTRTFAGLLLTERPPRYTAPSLLIVTTHVSTKVGTALHALRRRGRTVIVVLVATADATADLGGIPILRVEYDANWAKREALVLAA